MTKSEMVILKDMIRKAYKEYDESKKAVKMSDNPLHDGSWDRQYLALGYVSALNDFLNATTK